MPVFANRAKMTTATTGFGNAVLGSAVDGFQTFTDAGLTDGDEIAYVIEDGSDWEVGTGTYTTSPGNQISRTVSESSNAGSAINLSGNAIVYVTARAEDIEPANADILKADTHNTLTAGFDSDAEALGTISSGTVTPEVDSNTKENFKTLTANGAFTLAPPSTSSNCTIIIQVTNGASAGAITTSGFTIVNGDTYETTNGNDYLFFVYKVGSFSMLTVAALQ